jgi:predicted ATP-binding protein involved in virulence
MDAVFNPRNNVLGRVVFDEIEVKFLPSGTLKILPKGKNRKEFIYRFTKGKIKRETVFGAKASLFVVSEARKTTRDFMEGLMRLPYWGSDRPVDSDLVSFDAPEVSSSYFDAIARGALAKESDESTDKQRDREEILDLLRRVSIQFIRTQRLRHERSAETSSSGVEGMEHAVERISNELSKLIKESLRNAGSLGASLDRTFPKRLLEGTLPREVSEAKIRAKYEEQEKLRNRLMDVGLLETEEEVPLPDAELNDNDRKVLWYYLQDVEKKLRVYIPLLERVELFKSIIDDKEFLFKKMAINKDEGVQFFSDTQQEVPLAALSSGEQHELVLTYELLFGSQAKTLILIDEPELSLHVSWQQRFLEDMERIANLVGLDFVIATHSPSIVSHRTDLMVQLSGLDGA